MDSKEIKLKYPIPVPKEGGGDILCNIITLGRLKAKHLKLLPEGFMEEEGKISPHEVIPLIAGLADIPESAADEIDMIDIIIIAEELENFLSMSLENGESSSGE